jgi:hypothetical protein
MDSSFTIKPRPSAQKPYAPRDPVPVREAVETDLHISKTVTATGDGGGKQHDPRGEHHAHDLVADPESRAVIYRERELRSDDREHPDQALLRQRAYRAKSTAGTKAQADDDGRPGDPRADIEA